MHPIRRRANAAWVALAVTTTMAACTQKSPIASTPCDLNRGPCPVALANGDSGQITLAPRPLPLMKPISIRVDVAEAIQSARLDFQGTSMDMGFNQTTLRRDRNGELVGTAMLPVCATGAMRWRVDLYLDESTTPAARFEFDTGEAGR